VKSYKILSLKGVRVVLDRLNQNLKSLKTFIVDFLVSNFIRIRYVV
jgi:hypothetical protein